MHSTSPTPHWETCGSRLATDTSLPQPSPRDTFTTGVAEVPAFLLGGNTPPPQMPGVFPPVPVFAAQWSSHNPSTSPAQPSKSINTNSCPNTTRPTHRAHLNDTPQKQSAGTASSSMQIHGTLAETNDMSDLRIFQANPNPLWKGLGMEKRWCLWTHLRCVPYPLPTTPSTKKGPEKLQSEAAHKKTHNTQRNFLWEVSVRG